MTIQQILVYCTVAAALYFLYKKFFAKKKAGKGCDKNDCGCH